MTMYEVLHLRDDINRLYDKKKGRRELANNEGYLDTTILGRI